MKKLGLLLFFALTLGLFSYEANAAQNSLAVGNFPTVSPYPGLTLVQNINTAMAASASNNSGSSAPSYAVSDMFWGDTSNNLMKFTPNGSTFYPFGYFGGSTWTTVSDGVIDDAITATGSANAYVVTYSPAPAALVSGHVYKFFANFSVTGAATVNFNSLGALPLKKQGGTALVSGDIANNQFVSCVYDGTNCQITSQLATSGSGGVTSVATSSPVCGGTITGTGTIALCSQANNTVLANITGSSATPSATANPVVTSWGIGTTSSASGNMIHSPSTNAVAISTNGTDAITAYSDQGISTVGATGGDQGSGTINATGLYVNGVSVSNSSGDVLLHTTVCTSGSPCSSVTFNNSYLTTTYRHYYIMVSGFYTTDSGAFYINFSTNNGSSYLSSNYFQSGCAATSPNNFGCSTGQGAGGSAFDLGNSHFTTTATSTQPTSGRIDLDDMAQAVQAGMRSDILFPNSTSANTQRVELGGYNTTTSAINAVKLYDGNGGSMVGVFSLHALAQ